VIKFDGAVEGEELRFGRGRYTGSARELLAGSSFVGQHLIQINFQYLAFE
jgi:hypothetical protein